MANLPCTDAQIAATLALCMAAAAVIGMVAVLVRIEVERRGIENLGDPSRLR